MSTPTRTPTPAPILDADGNPTAPPAGVGAAAAEPQPGGNLNPGEANTPAHVLDIGLQLLTGNRALQGFEVAILLWPKGLPQNPAIASSATGMETGAAAAHSCELIAASMKPKEPELVVATPAHTAALKNAAGLATPNTRKPKLRT
jgi:hypothetical protein